MTMKVVSFLKKDYFWNEMDRFNAGNLVRQDTYKAFMPEIINRKWQIVDSDLLLQLSKADLALGRLDTFSELVDIELFVTMHLTKEATLSSKIEGTQTNFEEALMQESAIAKERRGDWREVRNYLDASHLAMELTKELPFSSRFIRRVHHMLMQGVRGQNKQPGQYRRSQNWIGGSSPSRAMFVPPPFQEVDRLMSDLENFANDDRNLLPDLVKAALIHYQFETIHPFLDGNGRIGRLLISSFLVERKVLGRPILYLSDFLERSRSDYYDRLSAVRERNDLKGWLMFFLEGVEKTASDGIETFRKSMALERSMPEHLRPLKGRASKAHLVVRQLFRNPIITVAEVSDLLKCTPSTGYRIVADLESISILRPIATGSRAQHYAFSEYISLFS